MAKKKKQLAHITQDLETLGRTSSAPPIQIGATVFNPKTGKTLEEFKRDITPESLIDLGVRPEFSTVYWWMLQSQEARELVFSEALERIPIKQAMTEYKSWIDTMREKYSIPVIWCHSSFDDPILRHVTLLANMEMPYEYWMISDIRTLKTTKGKPTIEKPKIAHDVIHDCRYQGEFISELLKRPDVESYE